MIFTLLFSLSEQIIPPTFIKPLMEMEEILGTNVQIGCRISGSLPITVEWMKDGTKLSGRTKHKLLQDDNSVSLEIECLEKADTGTYTCKLTNKAGSCESSGTLRVKGQIAFVAFISIFHSNICPKISDGCQFLNRCICLSFPLMI